MNGYFAYIRVSTAKQGELGSSLSEQRSSIETYAARQGLAIGEWFEERETAAKLGRTQFNIMMGRLAKRQAPGVIIHKIDRSARNLRDWARLGDLMDSGIDVRFAHESLDMGSRGGRLAADIQAVVAADFVRNLRQEIRKGIDGRLQQGLYPLPAPLGYENHGKGKRKEIDPVSGALVRTAFELYGTGSFTVDELRVEMAKRGLRNRRGSLISRSALFETLRQPFYIGLIHIKRTGRTYAGVHDALISKKLFDRCQAILTGRAYIRGGRHDFAFARLIKCAACGRSLIGERQKGHNYYRCHTISCRGTSLRESDVQAELCTLLSYVALNDEEMGELRDLKEMAAASAKEDRGTAARRAKLSLGRCDDLLERLMDAYLEGVLDRDLFEARKAKLLIERRGLLEALETPPAQSERQALLEKLELGKVALQQIQTAISAEVRNAVSLVMSNLVAQGKDLYFALLFPFDQVMIGRNSHNGTPYRTQHRNGSTMFVRRSKPTEHKPFRRFSVARKIARWERMLSTRPLSNSSHLTNRSS